MLEENFSAQRAADICGFRSTAMLDYLQRTGVFVPRSRVGKRRGKGRRYDFRDLMVLKTIATLLGNGASVAALKRALTEFQSNKWSADRASLQSEDGSILKYLVASGDKVYFCRSADNLFDLTSGGQLSFSFVVDLDQVHTDLCVQLSEPKLL